MKHTAALATLALATAAHADLTLIPHLNAATDAFAVAASDDGSTIIAHTSPAMRTVVWSDGAWSEITPEPLMMHDIGWPGGVSADGATLLGSVRLGNSREHFVSDTAGRAVLIRDLIEAEGLSLDGRYLYAADLSSDGRLVTGTLVAADGRLQIFTLTVPTPAGLLPIAGLLALARRRR